MAFCGNCGTKVDEGVKFCPGCGAAVGAPAQSEATEQQAPPAQENAQQTYQQQAPAGAGAQPEATDVTHLFAPDDIEKNKAMGILAYLIFFIPLLAAKDSPYARFHANQGLVLFLGYLICSVLWIIPILGWIAAPIGYVAFCVLTVIGLLNSLNGKAKNLPLVGKFKILK